MRHFKNPLPLSASLTDAKTADSCSWFSNKNGVSLWAP